MLEEVFLKASGDLAYIVRRGLPIVSGSHTYPPWQVVDNERIYKWGSEPSNQPLPNQSYTIQMPLPNHIFQTCLKHKFWSTSAIRETFVAFYRSKVDRRHRESRVSRSFLECTIPSRPFIRTHIDRSSHQCVSTGSAFNTGRALTCRAMRSRRLSL